MSIALLTAIPPGFNCIISAIGTFCRFKRCHLAPHAPGSHRDTSHAARAGRPPRRHDTRCRNQTLPAPTYPHTRWQTCKHPWPPPYFMYGRSAPSPPNRTSFQHQKLAES
jgi:hypothetical protein